MRRCLIEEVGTVYHVWILLPHDVALVGVLTSTHLRFSVHRIVTVDRLVILGDRPLNRLICVFFVPRATLCRTGWLIR